MSEDLVLGTRKRAKTQDIDFGNITMDQFICKPDAMDFFPLKTASNKQHPWNLIFLLKN